MAFSDLSDIVPKTDLVITATVVMARSVEGDGEVTGVDSVIMGAEDGS